MEEPVLDFQGSSLQYKDIVFVFSELGILHSQVNLYILCLPIWAEPFLFLREDSFPLTLPKSESSLHDRSFLCGWILVVTWGCLFDFISRKSWIQPSEIVCPSYQGYYGVLLSKLRAYGVRYIYYSECSDTWKFSPWLYFHATPRSRVMSSALLFLLQVLIQHIKCVHIDSWLIMGIIEAFWILINSMWGSFNGSGSHFLRFKFFCCLTLICGGLRVNLAMIFH